MSKSNSNIYRNIALGVRTIKMTEETLRALFKDYLSEQNIHSSGNTTLSKLSTEAGGNLEEVKISDKNIGAFRDTARKYDISYALMQDKTNTPPTWIIFFKADKDSRDCFERAFKEFSEKELTQNQEPIINVENIKAVDIIREKPLKESVPQKDAPNQEHQNHQAHDTPDIEPPFVGEER